MKVKKEQPGETFPKGDFCFLWVPTPPSFMNKKLMLVRLFVSQCSCETMAVPAPPAFLNWLANFYQI